MRPYETVQDRVRPYEAYIQPHMKSTSRVSSTVSISYINRMESNSTKVGGTVYKPCKCPVNRVKVMFNRTRPSQFDLILYVPSTIFQLYRDGSSWVEPVLS